MGQVLTVRKRLGRTRTWDITRAGQEPDGEGQRSDKVGSPGFEETGPVQANCGSEQAFRIVAVNIGILMGIELSTSSSTTHRSCQVFRVQ